MRRYRPLPRSYYRRPADEVACDLLGRFLVRELDGQELALRIVETEAYLGAPDRASHAWNGRRTARNETLYRPGGLAYVYFIYGMYHCLNAVTGASDNGEAVLIRAGEPVAGEEKMRIHRRLGAAVSPGAVAGGPGKLCQALRIDRTLDGCALDSGPLRIVEGEPVARAEIANGPRIGIPYAAEAVEWPLRFAVHGNRHVSRPFPWRRRSGAA